MSFMKKKSFVFWLAGVSFLWAWSFSFVLSAESDSSSLLLEVANVLYLASSLVAAGACIVFFRKPRIASMAPMNLATGLLVAASFLIVWGEYTGMASLLWLGKLFGLDFLDIRDCEIRFRGYRCIVFDLDDRPLTLSCSHCRRCSPSGAVGPLLENCYARRLFFRIVVDI